MTVIVYDGETLAADRQSTDEAGLRWTTQKLYIWGERRLAVCGDTHAGRMLVDWYMRGADPSKFPPMMIGVDNPADLFVITADNRTLKYGGFPEPLEILDEKWAAGTGGALAIGAMAMGAHADEAAWVACQFDSNCGRGVDILRKGGTLVTRGA